MEDRDRTCSCMFLKIWRIQSVVTCVFMSFCSDELIEHINEDLEL